MTHDPLCRIDRCSCVVMCVCDCQCVVIDKVRQAIVEGLKIGLPESDTRDAAVSIATFATSAT
jgi:hypothetical protein